MRTINHLSVRIEPFRPDDRIHSYILMFEVKCNGKLFNWHYAIPEDHLDSMIHRLFVTAEETIKLAIEKEEEKDAEPK